MTPEPSHPEPWMAKAPPAPAQGAGLADHELEQVGGLCQQVLGCLARIQADRQELYRTLCQLRAALSDLPERPEVLASAPAHIEAPRPEPLPVAGRPARSGPAPAAEEPASRTEVDRDAILRAEFEEPSPSQPAGTDPSPAQPEVPSVDFDSLLESEFGPAAPAANGSEPPAPVDYDSLLESEFGPALAEPVPSQLAASPSPAGAAALGGSPSEAPGSAPPSPDDDVSAQEDLPPWAARPASSRSASVWPQPAPEAAGPEESLEVSASREFLASAAALGQAEATPAPASSGSDLLGEQEGGLSRHDYLAYSRQETQGSAQSIGDGPMPWGLEEAPEEAFFSPQEISDDFFARASFRRRRR